MLRHLNNNVIQPKRVVILGAKGFVGAAIVRKLARTNIDTVAIGREELDLSTANAAEKLIKILHPNDALVIIAAKAPCKNHDMLLQNIQMIKPVCDALLQRPVQHVLYISSDAVYTDSMEKLNECSPAAPTSLHGVMHLAREQMLRSVVINNALAILRPSLLYGAQDPHNGYGPNSFYRLAIAGKPIELFGDGEEQRDHVYIEDVAEIVCQCLLHRSYGVLNLTTGEVVSFNDIAKKVTQLLEKPVEIRSRPRNMPMPHNGYRAFNNQVCNHAFRGFQWTTFAVGLKKMHQDHLQIFKESLHEGN